MTKICIFEAKTSIFVPSDHPNPLKNTFLTPLVCAFKKFLKKLFLGVLAIFGPPGGHFGFCRRCGVAGGERVSPAPLGWYYNAKQQLIIIASNRQMTWKNHLYGDEDNKGLIPQLNQRIGMLKLKRLSKFMSNTKLRYFSEGIFYSKLNYCLPVFRNVFGVLGG